MLTKNMYGSEFDSNSNQNTFGLRCGQMRSNPVLHVSHNGGWYNGRGEKLGFGDLNSNDVKAIMAEIPPGEIFVVIPEAPSYWDFYYKNSRNETKGLTEYEPGIEYVANHANWAIVQGTAYRVNYEGITIGDVTFTSISSRDLQKLMEATAALV